MISEPTGTTIEATFRIVTPMFCGGASPEIPELRLPSVKGALRYWWRTLHPGGTGEVAVLRDREANLFGSSDRRFGRSKVRMSLIRQDLQPIVKKDEILAEGRLPGAHYLGYGLMAAFASRKAGTQAGQLARGMIPGGEFTLECRIARGVARQDVDDVRRALALLGTVGGLGSRSRKGFGSLSLSSLVLNGTHETIGDTIEERLRSLIRNLPSGLPDWTAWTANSRVVVTTHPDATDPPSVLDELGKEQVYFRSWGHKGRVLSQDAERNFRHDHDLMKSGGRVNDFPHRVAFGLPHNYGPYRNQGVGPNASGLDRRASPLFLHVHQPDAAVAPVGVAAFLPALFLPDDGMLSAFGQTAKVLPDDETFWFPIHGWLDRLCAIHSPPPHRPGYDRFSNAEWWRRKTTLTGQEVSLV